MNKKVFVANLAYSISESALRNLFATYGDVVSVKIVTDNFTGRSKGFAFVEMDSEEQATAAIEGLNNKDCEGRSLKVDWAKPREAAPRADRGGMRGGDRGGFGGMNRRKFN